MKKLLSLVMAAAILLSTMAGITAIAEEGIALGLSPDKMGIATSQNYPDALAGAALCGKNRSVLLLADDKAMAGVSFPAKYKSDINRAYVFGGTFAVGIKTFTHLVCASQ